MHYTRNNTCIHAKHVREYQSQLWNNFSSLRTLQRSLVQTATLCEHSYGAIFIPKIYKSRSRDRRKNQSIAQFPEHINQTAANQSNDPLFPRRFRKTDIRFCRNVTKLESNFPTRGALSSIDSGNGLVFRLEEDRKPTFEGSPSPGDSCDDQKCILEYACMARAGLGREFYDMMV